jgi:hypothetical protein
VLLFALRVNGLSKHEAKLQLQPEDRSSTITTHPRGMFSYLQNFASIPRNIRTEGIQLDIE